MYVLYEFRSIRINLITVLLVQQLMLTPEKELRFIEKLFNEAHLLSIYKDYMINSSTL